MELPKTLALYEEMFVAERRFEALLRAAYGDDACNARYDYARNGSRFPKGDALRDAADAFHAATEAYFRTYRAFTAA